MKTMTTSTTLRALIATAIVSALASSVAGICTAAEATDVPQTIVKFGDLNVANRQGATALYARLRVAADHVCRPISDRDLASKARMNACVHKAIADAVAKIDQPALFAVYSAKNGQPTTIVLAAGQSR